MAHVVPEVGSGAESVTAKVRSQNPQIRGMQSRHHRIPDTPVHRVTVDQQNRLA